MQRVTSRTIQSIHLTAAGPEVISINQSINLRLLAAWQNASQPDGCTHDTDSEVKANAKNFKSFKAKTKGPTVITEAKAKAEDSSQGH